MRRILHFRQRFAADAVVLAGENANAAVEPHIGARSLGLSSGMSLLRLFSANDQGAASQIASRVPARNRARTGMQFEEE
jgi:hypothetical protein